MIQKSFGKDNLEGLPGPVRQAANQLDLKISSFHHLAKMTRLHYNPYVVSPGSAISSKASKKPPPTRVPIATLNIRTAQLAAKLAHIEAQKRKLWEDTKSVKPYILPLVVRESLVNKQNPVQLSHRRKHLDVVYHHAQHKMRLDTIEALRDHDGFEPYTTPIYDYKPAW
ncbi:hypothetical protein CXG81DRAFT_17833 [Caulochytrium protostelioides]|uniref:Uncharacterized protein n=1 Tax=Caulochytrium protostelioides TaxID=1555241 RepID=A0A4P9WW30_9FUNG|nr:hypothetical protein CAUPRSCDRAFT_12907 [Caulochytrium protostelioides]RKP02469.1 hypothetical protein CXG81DRAFT_17833 [Caulochytrium protostelioides]|eukprot:RKP02469.1 hypothetical protein CXG81DRAFT_17833 [Caulochytrium protostelioides]